MQVSGNLNFQDFWLVVNHPTENNATSAIKPQKVSTVKNVSVNRPAMPSALHASLTKLNGETLPSEAAGDKAAARSLILNVELLKLGYFPAKNKGLLLKSLADSHESLGKCVHLLSK